MTAARVLEHSPAPYAPDRPRRMGLVTAGETLRCLNGHRLHDPLVWDHGGVRCRHRNPENREDCGLLMYLIGGGLTSPAGKPIYLLAEITPAELQHMTRERMGWHDAVKYLGVYVGGETGGKHG